MPFRTANGLILLDVKVNGRAAVLLLDTGSNITLFRGLEHANDYITIEVGPGEQWGIMAANMKRLKTPDTEAYKGVRQLDGIRRKLLAAILFCVHRLQGKRYRVWEVSGTRRWHTQGAQRGPREKYQNNR